MESGSTGLAERVAEMVAHRRLASTVAGFTPMGLAAHHRADPEDREPEPAPLPAVGPDPLDELGAAVEQFDAAWAHLRTTIRRTLEARR
jgi:hypothetical protein